MWKKKFLVIDSAVPLCVGAILYWILAPDVFFVRILDGVLHLRENGEVLIGAGVLAAFLRNYFLDMLWGYALVPILLLLLGNTAADLKRSLCIAVLFSAVMEVLQLTVWIPGTFDMLDILAEVLAEGIAAANLLRMKHREERET